MADHARFSYTPGEPQYGKVFTRASTATYVGDPSDQSFVYWPGALHGTPTFSRASTATYVKETTAP